MKILAIVICLVCWNTYAIPRYHYRPSLIYQEGYLRINQMKLILHTCLGSDVYFISSKAEEDSPGIGTVEIQDPRLQDDFRELSRLISTYGGTAYIKVIWVDTSIDTLKDGSKIIMPVYRGVGFYSPISEEKN